MNWAGIAFLAFLVFSIFGLPLFMCIASANKQKRQEAELENFCTELHEYDKLYK